VSEGLFRLSLISLNCVTEHGTVTLTRVCSIERHTATREGSMSDLSRFQADMSAAVRAHWKAFLFEGILLAVLGLAAIILPPFASLAVTIFLGWMFLVSGIGGLIITFWARDMPGFWWSLISAALAVLAGMILIARPVQGVLTLTIVVGAYFLAEGVTTIMYALQHRRELSARWSWY
jgi:uncharacterized membrane protein HdeD (DUF308 family)